MTQAEQQFVVLAAAERQRRIVADRGAVGFRERQRVGVDFGADAAAFENVAKVLPQPVAQIDRGGRRFDTGEGESGFKARGGSQRAIDKKFARGRGSAEPSRENA
jgi:hypothetical protein